MNYKDLIVWQKSHALAIKIINLTDQSNYSYAKDMIYKQLLRAVTSTGANIAEGYGRHSGNEYVHYLQIAYGSANEVDNWLNLLKDAKLIDPEKINDLIPGNEEILKMLVTMIKKIKSKD